MLIAMEDVVEEINRLEQSKAPESDLKLLIVEMREGFKRVDDRLQTLQAAMDKRFSAIQWFIGMVFTVFAIILSLFGTFRSAFDEEARTLKMEKSIEQAIQRGFEQKQPSIPQKAK